MSEYPQLKSFEEKIIGWTDEIVRLSLLYQKERAAYGDAKADLDILLSSYILDFVDKKKNCGYEMGLQLLMATTGGTQAKDLYSLMVKSENRYKALEKIIEAYNSKVMSTQSIMRYYREGDQR